jgi:hypothetical protein
MEGIIQAGSAALAGAQRLATAMAQTVAAINLISSSPDILGEMLSPRLRPPQAAGLAQSVTTTR